MKRRLRRWLGRSAPSTRPAAPASGFGLIGASGWIARVHLAAIRDSGNQLLVAMDPSDAGIAILDEYFPRARFTRSEEELREAIAHLDGSTPPLRHVSICSPDDLHGPHVELCLECGVDAVCEKPLVIDPRQLDGLAELERETGRRAYPICQQRYNPACETLRDRLSGAAGLPLEIEVSYVAHRGAWYLSSWRGEPTRSGGLAMDIGIHFFDLLTWLCGAVLDTEVHLSTPRSLGGYTRLERAAVRWFLSIDEEDLPGAARRRGIRHWRSLRVGGHEIELTRGMKDLHRIAYQEILAGRGLTIDDVRPGLELAHRVRHAQPEPPRSGVHPLVERKLSGR